MDRVTVRSSRIEPGKLRPGDHIYAWRKIAAKIYSHHGIYESHEKIIHFNSSGVLICSLDSFLAGDELCLFAYGVTQWFYAARNVDVTRDGLKPQPTCTTEAEDPPETVLGRANDMLNNGGFGTYDPAFVFASSTYNFLLNNCMDFAFYCKTGRRYYDLVVRAGAGAGAVSRGVVVCARCVRPSGDGPADSNGSPEAARVVPPPPRHRSPERERAATPPPRRRWLPESGTVQFPRTNLGLPSLLDPIPNLGLPSLLDPRAPPRLLGRQETILGSAAVGSAAAALLRMAPFFL